MPLPYNLIALDLDETLLGPDHLISPRNARAVKSLSELGATVVIASGRMHEATLQFASSLGLSAPIISYNGALVKDPNSGETWLEQQVDGDLTTIVLDYCRDHGLQLNFYRDGKVMTAAMTPWMELYERRTLSPVVVMPDFYTALRGEPSVKLIIVDSLEKTNALLPQFVDIFGDKLYITKTTDEYLEFMPPAANKAAALSLVAEKLGVLQERTVAFGDSFNDIPMIRWAGLGVAVASAKPQVREAADRIVGRYDEDGVGIALEEIFGLKFDK